MPDQREPRMSLASGFRRRSDPKGSCSLLLVSPWHCVKPRNLCISHRRTVAATVSLWMRSHDTTLVMVSLLLELS